MRIPPAAYAGSWQLVGRGDLVYTPQAGTCMYGDVGFGPGLSELSSHVLVGHSGAPRVSRLASAVQGRTERPWAPDCNIT